ncbi:MAG: hypothetical protein ACJAX4_002234 [Clostridium sp.]
MFLAKGTNANLVDALVGSAYAAKGNNPIVLVDSQDGINAKLINVVTDNIKADSEIVRLGGKVTTSAADAIEAVKSDAVVGVESVSAISANDISVKFSKVPEDASNLTFEVAQAGNDVVVTTGWDTTGTIATLKKDTKFTSGTYTVNVMDGTTDLGTSDVTITEQKVAKINITSSKLGVTGNGDDQLGYATYNMLDQYGVDITNGALANNVQFQSGVGTVEARKGLLTVTPATGLNLMTFNAGVTITANDTSTGVSGSATLEVTSQVGTLSSIELTELTNKDNKVLTAGDTTDIFYAGFTATDISGNATSNYTLMKKGLIFTGKDGELTLTTSSPYVTAKLVQDPEDSNKGLIEVKADSRSISIDMPLIITAMTWTGSTSQITTTLKKQAEVDTFRILAPNDSIASGESKNIPFIAMDQNGVELTKFSDFSEDLVTFNNLKKVRNSDGTLSLKNVPTRNESSTSVPLVLSAMTQSGNYSSVTINIQKPVLADSLSLDTTVLNSVMQEKGEDSNTAVQMADFGWDNGGLTITDQYGRDVDINDSDNATYANYKVTATTDNAKVVSVDSNYAGQGETQIAIQAKESGSATVTFNLVDTSKLNTAGDAIVIDSKAQTFTVLADADIKDYTMDEVADPIYVSNGISSIIEDSAQAYDYDANPTVYGTTSTGAKVVLRGTPITGATSTSSDFTVIAGAPGSLTAPDDVEIVANKIADPAKTGSSTILTVTLLGADGLVHTVTTPVTSSTVDPLAKSLSVSVATEVAGISRTDDVVSLTGDYSALLGSTLAKYNADGSKTGVTKNVYFAPEDQYGSKASSLSQFIIVEANSNRTNGSDFAVTNKGMISGSMVTGDWITISGTTTNGLVKTIQINFGTPDTTVDLN